MARLALAEGLAVIPASDHTVSLTPTSYDPIVSSYLYGRARDGLWSGQAAGDPFAGSRRGLMLRTFISNRSRAEIITQGYEA